MIKYLRSYPPILLSMILSLTSCNDWLDVNDNPNTTQDVRPEYLFSYATTLWSGSRTGGDVYVPLSLSAQSQADGDRWVFYGSYYEVSTQSQNTWNSRYIITGNNLQLALERLADEKMPQPNAEAQCKILLAMQAYETTMLFGDIPFSEAWAGNKGIKYPRFDAQKDVLNGVITMLNEAIALIDPDDDNCIDEYDAYFKGDMNKWLAVAYSLKFRTLMVMADADPDKAKEIGEMLKAGQMVASADNNMEFSYVNSAGNENPKYRLVHLFGNKNMILFAHNNMITPMQKYNDSRLPRYFSPCTDGGFRGLETQEFYKNDDGTAKDLSMISDYLLRIDCPDLIYSYQEQLLLEAEAYARGLGVSKDLAKANELYRSGVKTACDYYGADTAKTSAFISNLPDLSQLSAEKAVYEIHLQQWVDLMDRPMEAFVQWRRSGPQGQEVPALTIPILNSHPGLMRRWAYPDGELTSNPNAPQQSPDIWEATWFDL